MNKRHVHIKNWAGIKNHVFFMACILLTIACKKLYNPTTVTTNYNYLVVEGTINNGADSTIITLTHTFKLTAKSATKPELKAVLSVEDDHNNSYPFTETGNGRYTAAPLNLNNTYNYRLRIKTADGLVYLSDYVVVKDAKPIDTLSHVVNRLPDQSGVYFYTSTHDDTKNSGYYRWDFDEDWRFHAMYESKYITTGSAIIPRTPNQAIYYCYGHNVSSSILLATTTNLSSDVVSNLPITYIPWSSEKLEIRYTMLLRQYALTKEAYEFWKNIKKNTETLGSIFDAQPDAARGNIHCLTKPDQPVIGYISAGKIQTKRIFIDHSEAAWGTVYPYVCPLDSNYYLNPNFPINQVALYLLPIDSKEIIIEPFFARGGGYLSTTQVCGDCTVRGKIAAPPFWR